MAKRILLFVILCFLVNSAVYTQSLPSGTGRYEALGNNPFMTDPAIDLNNNPAWGNLYRNYSFGDIGRANLTDANLYKLDKQYAGINFGLGKKMYAGLILNKEEGAMFDSVFFVPKPWGMGTLGVNMPIVPVKVLVGIAPSDKFSLGFSFYYAQKTRTVLYQTLLQ